MLPLLEPPVNPATWCFGPWEMGTAGGHGELVPNPFPRPTLAIFLVCVGFRRERGTVVLTSVQIPVLEAAVGLLAV